MASIVDGNQLRIRFVWFDVDHRGKQADPHATIGPAKKMEIELREYSLEE